MEWATPTATYHNKIVNHISVPKYISSVTKPTLITRLPPYSMIRDEAIL
jgi:hypothetical protein